MSTNESNLFFQVSSKEGALKMLEINQKVDSSTLEKVNSALSELTNSLFEFKEKVALHDSELEGKLFRFILANASMLKLIERTPINMRNSDYKILDLHTLNSISIMQIENFLIIYYLSFSKGSIEEKDMRYDLYRLHGLDKQRNFTVKSPFGEKKKAEINQEFETILEQLKSREVFNLLSTKEQHKLLKLKFAKTIKTEAIFKESGISRHGTDELWRLYSNHAHSEYISDRQFRSYYNNPKANPLTADLNIQFQIILTAKLCRFLTEKFESPKKVISRLDEDARILIYTWGYKVGGS